MDQLYVPVCKSGRLNERHYGALQVLDKADTTAKHGEAQVKIWRRSYDIPPPPMDAHDGGHPKFDRRYMKLDEHALPRSEEHTSELQSLMRISYAVFCLKKKKTSNRKASTHVLKQLNQHHTSYNRRITQ